MTETPCLFIDQEKIDAARTSQNIFDICQPRFAEAMIQDYQVLEDRLGTSAANMMAIGWLYFL